MMKTTKLYDDMPYEREFTGRVIDVQKGDGCAMVRLDRTLFFPEEGGQTSDIGVLNGFEVSHVLIKDGVITHEVRCDETELKIGDEVKGCIDWHHRFSNMQNHTGEHILSGIIHSRWGSENVGFHLSDNIVTLDTSKELDSCELKELEEEANKSVYNNLPVSCRYYDEDELKGMTYRSKIDLHESVRIVTIPGVDACACCAPHVANTGEIGIIKIVKAIRYKGGMRLTILAGERAYNYLRALQDTTDELSHMLSESTDKLTDAVQRILAENNELKIKIKNDSAVRLEADMALLDADSVDAVLFIGSIDRVVQRNAVNRLTGSHAGICAIFAGDEESGYDFIVAYPDGDAREVSKLMNEKLQARGGGSYDMVQGNVKASESDIRKALETMRGDAK